MGFQYYIKPSRGRCQSFKRTKLLSGSLGLKRQEKLKSLFQSSFPKKYKPVKGISAVVKVVDSHLCRWGSVPGKNCNFLIVSLLCFICSDQHVK